MRSSQKLALLVFVAVLLCDLSALAQDSRPSAQEIQKRVERSQWLLGRWGLVLWGGKFDKRGLEFKMEADGTISGYVVGPPDQLASEGYMDGMKVIAGIVDDSHSLRASGTWSHMAEASRMYSPARPGYKEDSLWNDAGIIFLEKETQILRGTPMLHSRNHPNWYTGKWKRVDLRPIEAQLTTYVQSQEDRVERLSRSGSQAERVAAADEIINGLSRFSDEIPEARQAVAVLSILRERGEIRRGSQLDAAISTLETSSNPNERSGAWAIMTAEILARGAHLARALANTEVTDKEAATLFLLARNASRVIDDTKNPITGPIGSNASRVTKNLNVIYGVAGTVQGAKGGSGAALIDGLRSLASKNMSLVAVLDIPAETVAAVLDVSRKGFGVATTALIDLKKTMQGDKEAEQRLIASSREMEEVVSGKAYGDAVLGSIKRRVLDRIPFVRSVAEWLQ